MLVDLITVVQAANVVLQAAFIVIVGLGYYFSVRATRVMGQEMCEERTTGGRPLITVSEGYESLPTSSSSSRTSFTVPRRASRSPSRRRSRARTASCSPIWSSSRGADRPGAQILCYRGKLENLPPMIQEGRLERDISVTVDYQGLTGGYAHQAARSFAGTGLPGAS